MDIHEIAQQIAGEVGGGGLHLRQGVVTAVAAGGSLSVKIGGSDVAVSGILAFDSARPAVGASVWLAVDGPLVIAIGTIGAPTMPTGAEMQWPVATPPPGWLIEDGSSQLITDYPDLSALIRGTYSGADAAHFYLPDMRGVVPVGYKSGDGNFGTLGGTGGEKTHTLATTEMPSHTHPIRLDDSPSGIGLVDMSGNAQSSGTATGSTGGGLAHNNLQPYRVRNFVIKT